jgi:hypothetical protein
MASVTTGLEDLSGEWPMVRVLQRFASAQRALFETYQIDAVRPGESVAGGYQPSDSLAEVARRRAVDVAEMIEQIKKEPRLHAAARNFCSRDFPTDEGRKGRPTGRAVRGGLRGREHSREQAC